MNKYQEALNAVEKIFYGTFQGYIDENEVEAIRELVDKATPMKPIAYSECPVCDENVFYETKKGNYKCFTYCTNCGQKIDWSEDE